MIKRFGTVSLADQLNMSGVEFVRGLASGELPMNTLARTEL